MHGKDMSREDEPEDSPCVGILWFHCGVILARTCVLEEGVDHGQFVNCPFDHVTSWEDIHYRESIRFPELSIRDYEEVLRGRVLYDRTRAEFVCYLDRAIDSAETRSALQAVFSPNRPPMKFRPDDHYTTDQDELNRLFGLPVNGAEDADPDLTWRRLRTRLAVFDGVFFCSTNLMDDLDPASAALRPLDPLRPSAPRVSLDAIPRGPEGPRCSGAGEDPMAPAVGRDAPAHARRLRDPHSSPAPRP